MTTSQSEPVKDLTPMLTIEVAISELKSIQSTTDVVTRFQNDLGVNELNALVLLKECLETGCTEKIASAMDEDVCFLSKWHTIVGKTPVLQMLSELSSSYRSAKAEFKNSTSFSNAQDEERSGHHFKPFMIFVDGSFRGFSLAVLRPSVPGAASSYSISLESYHRGPPKKKSGLIHQIFANHFKHAISGWAMFSSLRCVPSPQVLRQTTQFDVRVHYDINSEIHFLMLTLTEQFECVLKTGDVTRLVQWANAVACNVDRCTVFLWQRCQIEITARALGLGWVRLMISSARAHERYDLVAVVSVHELVSKLRASFGGLANASPRRESSEPLDQLDWPIVSEEINWIGDATEMQG